MSGPTKADIAISQNAQNIGRALDEVIADIAGERMGFLLITFSLNASGSRAGYVSNCQREQMIPEIKRLLALWESGMPDVPNHEFKA